MTISLSKPVLMGSALLSAAIAVPVVAQQEPGLRQLEEIVVTARRREERLQDVPVSITVFSQENLSRSNIFNASDLATYTPSLQANTRFGAENSTFAIRGFSQELRTTASVGVYFAEVIAPRGANSSQSGDGAGPGDFFDLENVQVLKGPQGTLFGRNTTGGAILLTPKKPVDDFEGYAEVSTGNYDMWRGQAVINIPFGDRFRVRLGVDSQQRDGYMKNISGIGPRDFADVDYTAVRASAVLDIADNIENYTIIKASKSDNNGYPGSLIGCNPNPAAGFAGLCLADQMARQAAGNDGFYDVYSYISKPLNEVEQWQIINTTTWELSDRLTIKGLLSYADYESRQRLAINGTNWNIPTGGGPVPLIFAMAGQTDNNPTGDQETLVAELQFQGTALDEKLTWQAGLYYEKSKPGSDYGSQSPGLIACDLDSITSSNPADFRCNNLFGVGALQSEYGGATYKNQAIYAQATYELNEVLSVTGGLRYTDDQTDGYVTENIYYFPTDFVTGAMHPYIGVHSETRKPSTSSEEPTWLLGLDYKPSDNVLLYAKYARGYRQGSVNLAGSTGFDVHNPEKVDNYELGAKTSFAGLISGTFNIAAFYNDFQDQQIQYGYFKASGVGTTAILNAGASTIWGVEIESSLQLTDDLTLSASYTYLDTEVDKLAPPPVIPGSPALPNTSTAEGEPLSFSPKNNLVLSANYHLPVDANWGDLNIGATYVYTDEVQAVSKASSALAVLPSYSLVNLHFNWNNVASTPVDLSLFATNVTDKKYVTFIGGNWNNGMEYGRVGTPKMYGMRIKYNF